jgi:predicted small lipoprotein YifL
MKCHKEQARQKRWEQACMGAMLVLFAWGLSGCGRKAPNYVPSRDLSRQALETALNAWQSGRPVGKTIEAASLRVQVVDSGWGKKQKLGNYEILEEVSRPDGKRCFKTRLHLLKPQATQEVHYIVVGKDPLWIFREEDYKDYASWEGYK